MTMQQLRRAKKLPVLVPLQSHKKWKRSQKEKMTLITKKFRSSPLLWKKENQKLNKSRDNFKRSFNGSRRNSRQTTFSSFQSAPCLTNH